MRSLLRPLACCALCVAFGGLQGIAAQTAGVSKKRIPGDPVAAALNNLLGAAQAAMDRKDYPSAARNYQDYLAKKPDDAAVHFDLGYTYTAMQRPADAKSEYAKAISLDPKMAPAYLNLGLTLLESDPGAAVEPLQKAADLMPGQAHPKFLLGVAFERSAKLPAAIEQYQAAAELDGKNFDVRLALGRTLLDAGRANNAEPEFRAALALRPDSAPAHLGLAESLLAQKKLEPGATELGAYLQTQPNDTHARIERASLLVDLGKTDDALAELDRAAEGGSEGMRALKLRSQIYFEKKRYDDAVPVLQKAAALGPHDPDIPARLGHVYLEKKDYANAISELIVAHKMSPDANDVLTDLVVAEYRSKNYSAALQALDVLSKRETLPAGSWFVRAVCYDKLGQPAEALDAYQRFLQLNKDENNDMYFESAARARILTRELQNKKR